MLSVLPSIVVLGTSPSVASREHNRATHRIACACCYNRASKHPLRRGGSNWFSRAVSGSARLSEHVLLLLRRLQPNVDSDLDFLDSRTAVGAAGRVFRRLVSRDRWDVQRHRSSIHGCRSGWLFSGPVEFTLHRSGLRMDLVKTPRSYPAKGGHRRDTEVRVTA